MARRFRRTEEQLRASVRGLNRPPGDFAQETPQAPPQPPRDVTEPVVVKEAPTKRPSEPSTPVIERVTVPKETPAPGPELPRGPLERRMEAAAQETQEMEGSALAEGIEELPTQEVVAAALEPEPQLDGAAAVSIMEGTKIYGEGATAVRAIDKVTHAFPKGQFMAIMGPSGSGKSTLLHCLAGLDDLTSGRVFIGKVELTALDEKAKTMVRRDKVGFIFQSFNLVPTLTALENITLPMELANRDPDSSWVNYLVQAIGLADRLDHLPSELSGGQQQRVAAARALAGKPDIVFADEPTGNLDSRRSNEILQFLREAVDEFGQTIVMVTHDPIAASFADNVVFLSDGRIVSAMAEPTVEKVLDEIKALEA
jgi:putative ABC transport system ATP-binding protein